MEKKYGNIDLVEKKYIYTGYNFNFFSFFKYKPMVIFCIFYHNYFGFAKKINSMIDNISYSINSQDKIKKFNKVIIYLNIYFILYY